MNAIKETTVTPAELREAWTKIQSEGPRSIARHPGVAYHAAKWQGTRVDQWIGASGAQIQDWLENGYYPEDGDTPNLRAGTAEIDSPMMALDEEDGDLLIDAVLNGDDLYRARWENFEAKRGMSITVRWGLAANTPAKVLIEYGDWILRVIDSAERQGIAPDVDLVIKTRATYAPQYSGRVDIRIPLVKAGEIVDMVAWRAFFHGGAFRTLGFLALGLAGDHLKLTAQSTGLGSPAPGSWDVSYADDTLTIDVPMTAQAFPVDEMTVKLEAAMEAR